MSEQAPQRSLELFRSGFFCAESVLLAIAESQGIQSDLIPRIATGFAAAFPVPAACAELSAGRLWASISWLAEIHLLNHSSSAMPLLKN